MGFRAFLSKISDDKLGHYSTFVDTRCYKCELALPISRYVLNHAPTFPSCWPCYVLSICVLSLEIEMDQSDVRWERHGIRLLAVCFHQCCGLPYPACEDAADNVGQSKGLEVLYRSVLVVRRTHSLANPDELSWIFTLGATV